MTEQPWKSAAEALEEKLENVMLSLRECESLFAAIVYAQARVDVGAIASVGMRVASAAFAAADGPALASRQAGTEELRP